MTLFNMMPDRLCEWFSDKREFDDCSFCVRFPPGFKSTPITKPVVTIGIKSIDVVYRESDGSKGRAVQEKYSVGIYVPRSMGGSYCTFIFERLARQLLFNNDIYIYRMTAGEVEYVRDTDSLFMEAVFETQEGLSAAYPEDNDRFTLP